MRSPGGLGHAREGRVCWLHAGVFTAAALPGIIAGTALANTASGGALIATFAVIMLVAVVATWRRASGRTAVVSAAFLGGPPGS